MKKVMLIGLVTLVAGAMHAATFNWSVDASMNSKYPGDGYTSPGAAGIGIEQGYVSHDRGPIYAYRINFYNSKGWHFTFKDESGDTYGITTIRNGWHYIDYNSDKPIMIGVS